ncbi:MAG: hypothetical protein AAF570_22285, partial [Bacteroidota bacterium]
MAETTKKYRLFKVAKELNTGMATLVDHLSSKGFEVDNSPNAKLTQEMYHLLLRDFASEILLKQKAEEIKEKKQEKRMKAEEAASEEDQEPISAEQLRSGFLEGSRSKNAPRPETRVPTPKPESETVQPKAEKTPEKPPVEESKAPALKIKGKIDLSQFDRKKSKKKPAAEKPPVKKDPPPVKESKPEPKPPAKERAP